MCMLRKRLPYNQKTRDKLAKLPKIYLIACWAHYGVVDFPFSGKYKKVKDADGPLVKYIPLVWDFDDHNGVYPEYVLRPITWTTTAAIRGWVRNEQQAKDTAEFCEKRRVQAAEEKLQELKLNYEERVKEFGSEEAYLMAIFGEKKESDNATQGENHEK